MQTVKKTNRKFDTKVEKEVAKFLDENLYSNSPGRVTERRVLLLCSTGFFIKILEKGMFRIAR